ncbi:MAG: M4 family metallopeptidase [Salibacteraceae bacterium]
MIYRYLLITGLALVISSPLFSQIYTGAKASKLVRGAETVRLKPHSSVPDFVRFRIGSELSPDEVEGWLKQYTKGNNAVGLRLLDNETDPFGYTHYRFQQTYRGLPIELSRYLVHVRNGKVVSMNGVWFDEIPVKAVALSEGQALQQALDYIGAQVYKWEIPAEEEHLQWEEDDHDASYFPRGSAVLIPLAANMENPELRAAWKFNIYAHQPMSRREIYIDAADGSVVFENDLIHHGDSVGSAVTGYSGTQTITADYTGSTFRLRETGRGNGVQTLNMQNGTSYNASVDFTDADNFWNNANASADEFAGDAHWGAEVTYDYFWLEHSRNSIDGSGFLLRSYVHYDSNFGNAFWDGQRMTYGDGNNGNAPFTALDIAGHEVTHGLTTFSAGLIYQNESGALNESFSDIFGTAIEFYGKPMAANWTVGEDLGFVIRNMANPNAANDPDTYLGTNWFTGTGDNGGVHINSGVQNFWYYLLVNGGTGTNDIGDSYAVTALGFSDASAIAFRNLTVYLTPSSNYADARFFGIQAAIDLFGHCSPEVESTTDAWHAVGIGPAYTAGVSSDFAASGNESCEAPFLVAFSNNSSNASSFTWNFGDGNTSSQPNPNHVYSNYGTYTVSLVADGGSCGIDTLIEQALIVVDSNGPCIAELPENGSGSNQDGCLGKLYDNGGPTGDYDNNTNSWVTIAPVGAATVTVTFNSFDVEAGTTGNLCDFDYIEVFDGPTTQSPSLGRFCNNNLPPASITSTGGSITILQFTDQGLTLPGFELQWTCNLPVAPPTAAFATNTNETCTGTVAFTDQSSNAPNQWLWNFGDGNSSTVQNPVHTYASAGSYTVTLTATNNIGVSNPLTQTNAINVTTPAAPSANNAAGCIGQSSVLMATGNHLLRWYDQATGGSPLDSGANYQTPIFSAVGQVNYYVEEVVLSPTASAGALDNNIGGGGNFNNGIHHLKFDVFETAVIHTVKVYAGSPGDRTIELRNSAGQVLQDATIFLSGGEERITLDFDVAPGTDYELGVDGNGTVDLYRNNSGANYPYTVPGILEITRSSANSNPFGFYYFFYDWEVHEPHCVSPRTPVTVNIEDCPPIGIADVAAVSGVEVFPNPVDDLLQVQYVLNGNQNLEVAVLNATGQRVVQVFQGTQLAGAHQMQIATKTLAPGIYFLELRGEGLQHRQKLVVMH